MKASILQEHLLPPLLFVGKNISLKTQLPITQHILFVIEKGQIWLSTTTLETTTRSTVAAKTEKEGGICVPSKLFMDLVASLPQEKIDIEIRGQSLFVESGGYSAVLPGISAGEFPTIPKKRKGETRVNAKEFIAAIKSVLYAAATDEGRPILTGIKIKKEKEGTLFVATDGYRLSLKHTNVFLKEDFDRVIPARALFHILHTEDEKEVGFVETEDGQAGFFVGDNEIYTRVIEGDYPAFERIIPKNSTTTVVWEKDELVKAVKTAAIFARDSANIVRFHIDKKSAVLSANTPQVGESKIELNAEVDGDGGDIAFNSRFLLDFFSNVSAEKLRFEMTGSLNPGVFRVVGDDSFLHIIMPVRVQE